MSELTPDLLNQLMNVISEYWQPEWELKQEPATFLVTAEELEKWNIEAAEQGVFVEVVIHDGR